MDYEITELNILIKDLNEQQKTLFFVQYNFLRQSIGAATIFAFFNIDRVVFGEIFLGIVKFFSGGGFGIWWLIDLFSIRTRVYQSNKSIAHQLFQAIKANS